MYNNGAVDWSTKNVKMVPASSHEAESALASRAAKATCFIRELLKRNLRPLTGSTPMLGDNKALYDTVQQEGASARTRYYERATLLIKRAVLLLILYPYLVLTNFMLADIYLRSQLTNRLSVLCATS